MNILQDLKLQYYTGGVAQKIIFWNIGFFVFSMLFNLVIGSRNSGIDCLDWVSLSSNPQNMILKPWSIISYAFFHSGFMHIFFNMLILNFSSRLFLTLFSGKQFIGLYFVGAIFAGVVYVLCYFLLPSLHVFNSKLVGASGAIMAVLIAATTKSPLMEIRLMLIGNIKLWQLSAAIIFLDLIQLPLENTGGHIAHLGGALFGFLYIKQINNGTDITSWFNVAVDFVTNIFRSQPKQQFKKVIKNNQEIVLNKTNLVTKTKSQQQVDDILEKISKSGYDSLSDAEKDLLFKFGQ